MKLFFLYFLFIGRVIFLFRCLFLLFFLFGLFLFLKLNFLLCGVFLLFLILNLSLLQKLLNYLFTLWRRIFSFDYWSHLSMFYCYLGLLVKFLSYFFINNLFLLNRISLNLFRLLNKRRLIFILSCYSLRLLIFLFKLIELFFEILVIWSDRLINMKRLFNFLSIFSYLSF